MRTTVGILKELIKDMPDDTLVLLPKLNYTIQYPGEFVEVRPAPIMLSDQDPKNPNKFINARHVLTFLPTIRHTHNNKGE